MIKNFAIFMGIVLMMTPLTVLAQTETITETQYVIPFTEYLNEGTFMMLFVILVVSAITIIIIKRIKVGKK